MPLADDVTQHRAQMPEGASAFLNARSLATSHRRLAQLLQPGLRVLDVGCGTGAITAGIAAAVRPSGQVVGIDANARLLEEALRASRRIPGLSFAVGDVYRLPVRRQFDVVTASRVLQWLAHPVAALQQMVAATRPGGRVVVLDYNHEHIR